MANGFVPQHARTDALALEREKFQEGRRKANLDALRTQMDSINNLLAAGIAASQTPESGMTREGLSRFAKESFGIVGTLNERMRELGDSGAGQARFFSLLKSIASDEELAAKRSGLATSKGRAAGQEKVAESAITGAPAAPAQTKKGKLIQDRQILTNQFGENSVQVRAFDEAAESQEPPKLTDIAGVRKEFTKQSSEFIGVRDAFSRVRIGAETPSAAGDVALVFNFMKMLDPDSVVREGEFALAAAAAGVPDRIVQLARRVDTGERLTPPQRRDFLAVAQQVFEAQRGTHLEREKVFRALAKRLGMNPDEVVIDFAGDDRDPSRPAQKLDQAALQTLMRNPDASDADLAKLNDEQFALWWSLYGEFRVAPKETQPDG